MTTLGTILIGCGAALIAGGFAFGKPKSRTYPSRIVFEPGFDALPGEASSPSLLDTASIEPALALSSDAITHQSLRPTNVHDTDRGEVAPITETSPHLEPAARAYGQSREDEGDVVHVTATDDNVEPEEIEAKKPATVSQAAKQEHAVLNTESDPIPLRRRFPMLSFFTRLRWPRFRPSPPLDTGFLDDLPPASALRPDDDEVEGTFKGVPSTAKIVAPATDGETSGWPRYVELTPIAAELFPSALEDINGADDVEDVAEDLHALDVLRRQELEQRVLFDRETAQAAQAELHKSASRAMDEALAATDAAYQTAAADAAVLERLNVGTAWAREITKSDGSISLERRRVLLEFYADLPNGMELLRRVRDQDPEMSSRAADLIAERINRPAA